MHLAGKSLESVGMLSQAKEIALTMLNPPLWPSG